MFKVQDDLRSVQIAPYLKMAVYQIVYQGPDEGVVKTDFTVFFALAVNMETGLPVRARWEKGGSCVQVGPFGKGEKGIVKLRVEGW
jgi:hypothetical protein